VILAFSPSKDVQFTAQAARGFRLGGINDPLNVTLCTPADLTTYSGHPNWKDEKVMNYELGAKTRLADGRVTFNSAVFMTQVDGLQVIADAGSCSSRIILNADAETLGAEVELFSHPNAHFDYGISATYVDAKITKTFADSTGTPVAGIRDGNRLPTSPQLQAAVTGAFNFTLGASLESYVRLTAQYVGSSYTQLADQEPNFGVISNATPLPPGAASLINLGNVDGNPNTPAIDPLTINFDSQLPSYEIVNLKWGFNTERWEGSVYVNNLLDERAFLSVDRERGRRARVGYLTNPPRTYGMSFRMNF
jgi:iron complex outermembrane receptor protein